MLLPQDREVIDERLPSIDGWLNDPAAYLTCHLWRWQSRRQIRGPVVEIGVYRAKYLSLLYHLSAEDREPVWGFDLWVGGEPEVAMETVRSNVRTVCGSIDRLRLRTADSLSLTPDALPAKVRFVSVDGEHTAEAVVNDLALASGALGEAGIVALDDSFNHQTPGVIEGFCRYSMARSDLVPFTNCHNKLFLSRPEWQARYLEATQAFLEEESWLPSARSTREKMDEFERLGFVPELFGYQILPFG